MVDKLPWQGCFFGKQIRESLHSKGLRGIVSGIEEVHPQFLRRRVGPMRPLPGDECIDAGSGCFGDIPTRSASHNADFSGKNRAARSHVDRSPHGSFQVIPQNLTIDFFFKAKADRLAGCFKKWFPIFKSNRRGQ